MTKPVFEMKSLDVKLEQNESPDSLRLPAFDHSNFVPVISYDQMQTFLVPEFIQNATTPLNTYDSYQPTIGFEGLSILDDESSEEEKEKEEESNDEDAVSPEHAEYMKDYIRFKRMFQPIHYESNCFSQFML